MRKRLKGKLLRHILLSTLAFCCLYGGPAQSQPPAMRVISGTVRDAATGETLPGAHIRIPGSPRGTATNNYGAYMLRVPLGVDSVLVSYVGYTQGVIRLNSLRDTTVHAALHASLEIGQVVVEGETDEASTRAGRMGSITIPMKAMERVPVLLGERDVFRIIQLQPGVQRGIEGTSGFYVRGGTTDQNLVMLDGAPVYNAYHLMGLFSHFNGNAIKRVELMKGAFPARYGGRISSVVDVVMAEGSMRQWKGEAGIGLISSHGMVQGPIVKDKASFILTGRRTYLDLIMRPFLRRMAAKPKLYFYDATAKVNWQVTDKDRIHLSAYLGRDGFGTETTKNHDLQVLSNMGLGWGNATGTLRWSRQASSTLFTNATLIYSQYKYEAQQYHRATGVLTEMYYKTGIRNVGLKYDAQWEAHPAHSVRMGISSLGYQYAPQARRIQLENERGRRVNVKTHVYSVESALYLEDDMRLWNWGQAQVGVRLSHYATKGYSRWDVEPRASLSIFVTDHMAVKGGFAMMNQHMHLLSSYGLGLPTDIWVPASKILPSQRGWVASAGITHELPWIGSSITVEGYYKPMHGNIAYRTSADSYLKKIVGDLDERFWETMSTSGQGWSSGLEVLLQRRVGRLSGWIGYTLSWSKQQYEELNGGKPFWAKHDRRHDLSVVAMFDITARWRVSATWIFASGSPISLPRSTYDYREINNERPTFLLYNTHYDGINTVRMPAYHRLDVGVQYMKQGKRLKHTLSFDIYNVYNRHNPLFYYYQIEQRQKTYFIREERLSLRQVALFPIVPSVTYKLSF